MQHKNCERPSQDQRVLQQAYRIHDIWKERQERASVYVSEHMKIERVEQYGPVLQLLLLLQELQACRYSGATIGGEPAREEYISQGAYP